MSVATERDWWQEDAEYEWWAERWYHIAIGYMGIIKQMSQMLPGRRTESWRLVKAGDSRVVLGDQEFCLMGINAPGLADR
jgi:hypothetical protein